MAFDAGRLKELLRDVPDFPQSGVVFKDITPVLADHQVFSSCVEALAEPFRDQHIDKVLGIEARGFIVATPVALSLGAGFVPVRKAGKLPWKVERETYQLEYGTDTLEMHSDVIEPGDRVLIVDDVLATGGTASAVERMTRRMGAEVVAVACLLELSFLKGRERLGDIPAHILLSVDA